MNERLAKLARNQRGVFTRAQALGCGYDDEELYRAVRAGRWRRVRRGAYIEVDAYDALDDAGKHLVRVHAVALSLRGPVAFSHTSAALLHGFPLWDADLRHVHVTRVGDGVGRIEGDVVHHVGELDDDEVVLLEDLPAVGAARAVVETATLLGFERGVVTADAALHAGATTKDELLSRLELMRPWPGSRRACAAVSFADGGAESVGESRARVLFHEQGLPAPELQKEIRDPAGRLVGRVDFYFAEWRTVVEFDGKLKYTDPKVLYREKRREDGIRELAYGMARIGWTDLDHAARTAARVRRTGQRHVGRTPT